MSDTGNTQVVYDTVEEAEEAAAEEAERAGFTNPSAVMKTAREGHGVGSKDTPR